MWVIEIYVATVDGVTDEIFRENDRSTYPYLLPSFFSVIVKVVFDEGSSEVSREINRDCGSAL